MKGETIPRLELIAALLLAQLVTAVHEALSKCVEIERVVCWSDSKCVLFWVHNEEKDKKPFIQNRVKQIRNLVSKEKWAYCPTSQNPSDIASRGIECSKIQNNQLWWNGPIFLKSTPEFWPKFELDVNNEPELKEKSSTITIHSNVLVNLSETQQNLSEIFTCEHYSSLDKLFRVTAIVLKFVNNLKRKIRKENANNEDRLVAEFNQAKVLWHKEVQKSFNDDPKHDHTAKMLGTFVDTDGVIRVGGRLQNSPLP